MKNVYKVFMMTVLLMGLSACALFSMEKQTAFPRGPAGTQAWTEKTWETWGGPTIECQNQVRFLDVWYEVNKKDGLFLEGFGQFQNDQIYDSDNSYAGHLGIANETMAFKCQSYNAPAYISDCFAEGQKIFQVEWVSTQRKSRSDILTFKEGLTGALKNLNGKSLKCTNKKVWD